MIYILNLHSIFILYKISPKWIHLIDWLKWSIFTQLQLLIKKATNNFEVLAPCRDFMKQKEQYLFPAIFTCAVKSLLLYYIP